MAKPIPFSPGDASEDELMLVAAGKMRLAEGPIDVDELWKIKTGTVDNSDAITALLKEQGRRTVKKTGEPAAAFWDSSALVPLCIQESTSREGQFPVRSRSHLVSATACSTKIYLWRCTAL